MKYRIDWIDNLKAVCILFVLLSHLDSGSPVLDTVYTPVFLTGFLFAAGYTHRPEPDFFVFLRKKLGTLLWPWFFFSTFNLLLAQVFSFQSHGSLWEELTRNYLQIRGEGDGLWFLAALFMAFLPFFRLIRWQDGSRKRQAALLPVSLLLSALSVWYTAAMDPSVFPWNSPALPWHLEYVFQAVFFMVLGWLARQRNWQDRGWWSVALYAAALIAARRIPLWLWYPWQYVLQITGVFALMAVSRKLPAHPVLTYLGRNTLLCFALHGKVMSLLQWALRRLAPGGYALALADPWLSPVLALILTVLMALILLVPIAVINRWFPFLLGRKRPGYQKKLNGTVIVTYRCNARCTMCSRYKAPSRPEEEITPETLKKLPRMYFTNITGGEPFLREDLRDIVRVLREKSDRIVISTNGFFTDRIVALCREFPDVGIRISIEGLEATNNAIRGLPDGYRRGMDTLNTLRELGLTDIGLAMTVQDANAADLQPLYAIARERGLEFATAAVHNSFYFVETDNRIRDRHTVAGCFEGLINDLLRSKKPKDWFRAYFNHGLIHYICGRKRLLPCDMSFDTFFLDPYGDVMPCNGTREKQVMGNLNRQSWAQLWNSPQAEAVRKQVRRCDRNCWMIGSVSPAMHKYLWVPAFWVARHKLKGLFTETPYSMYEIKALREGTGTREAPDRCPAYRRKCDDQC